MMRDRVVVLLSALAWAGSALAQDVTLGWLGAATTVQDIQRCAPNAKPEQIERWRKNPGGSVVTFADSTTDRFVALTRDMWVCLRLSTEGYVVVPADLLAKAVSFRGVAPEKAASFYAAIQAELARTGAARALVAQPGGKRLLVYLTVDSGPTTKLSMRTSIVQADNVNDADFPIALWEAPVAVTSQVTREGQVELLANLLAPRPLHGNYLQIEGSPLTQQLDVVGTTWRSTRKPSEFLRFEPAGVLMVRSRLGNSLGSWTKEGGALYFYNKAIFHSAVLDTMDGLTVLDVEIRRAAFTLQPVAGLTPSTIAEYRGRSSYVRTTDKAAVARLEEVWARRSKVAREAIEQQRELRMGEAEEADWGTRMGPWSLCVGNLYTEAIFVAEMENSKETEICRTFLGNRRAWQAVVQEGCNGRCFTAHVPTPR